MRRLALLLATCGYIGVAPMAPGTVRPLLPFWMFVAWVHEQ